MDIITLTKNNIDLEHICCAISNNQDSQVISKKNWLKERFDDGLVFKKGNIRGKCFIEYIPAENAWSPIIAPGYMNINCFWISGQYKGKGYSNLLLSECIKDSQNKNKSGLVVLSSNKKLPFLSDPNYLHYKGFILADTADPSYELLYLPFNKNAAKPYFKGSAKHPHIEENGFVLYYSHQCPFNAKYVPLIEKSAEEHNIPFKTIRFETTRQAQNSPAPFTIFSLFYNKELVSAEIMSVSKFEKLIEKLSKEA